MATGFALLSIDAKGTPSTTLGPKMGMESTSLSRLLNTMEERNLIYRSQNPDDGRSILIHLTSFGKEKRDDSKGVVLHFNKIIEESLSPEKINIFFEVMNKIKEKTQNFEYFTPILKTK
jgi:DNA-binding MarR family transcriptional regulator